MDIARPLYVVGGSQRPTAHFESEWHGYRQGVILRADPAAGTTRTMAEYVSPPEVCAEDKPSILFKAGSVMDGTLYVCTQTELVGYSLPDFEQTTYLTLPLFNDLHHVAVTAEGNFLVAVTGLDLVVEVDGSGEKVGEWNVLGKDPWHRFSRSVDYRRVLTTKPHESHPNFVFHLGEDLWVTRFEQRDAVNLNRPHERIQVGGERVHDGMVHGASVYFTTVDGHVVVADIATKERRLDVDLNKINEVDRHLGWCRGLHVVDEYVVVVGFSRLRPSAIRENLRWVKHRMGRRADPGNLPTRIACYDLRREDMLWEHNVEEFGLNAIFSIHPANGEASLGASGN